MLGPLTQSTENKELETRKYIESQLESKLRDLKLRLEELEGLVSKFREEVVTETLIADKVNSTEVNTRYLESNSILTDKIKTKEAEIESLIIDLIETKEISANKITGDLYGQLLNYQNQIDANSVFANKGKFQGLESNKVKTDLLETINLTLESLTTTTAGFNDLYSRYGRVQVLESTSIDTENLKSNKVETEELETGSVKSTSIETTGIKTEYSETEVAKVKLIDAPEQVGKVKLPQLEPNEDLPTADHWYTLKIKKGVDFLSIGITDEVDLKIISSYSGETSTDPTVAKHSTMVVLHQKQLNNVQLISEDDEYYYIELSPPVGESEIEYRYQSRDIENPLEILHTTTVQSYKSYYAPVKLAEIIVFGNSNPEDESFQFTILGKLWAKISPDFEDTKFDSIHISHNIHTKDYFDEQTGDWVYKPDTHNQYLSSVKEYFDEIKQEWVTHIIWKDPVDNDEIQPLNLTEDSKEDVLKEDGEKIGERDLFGTKHRLVTTNTIANWNGKVEEPGEEGEIEEYNPLTKLGNVDEGNWEYEAGHLHTKELGIKNSIKWSNDEELDQKDYQVWLNGSLPEDEDLEWVRR